jgi:hypothetical protein
VLENAGWHVVIVRGGDGIADVWLRLLRGGSMSRAEQTGLIRR